MTNEELDRLATLIAGAIESQLRASSPSANGASRPNEGSRDTWLRSPVRPEPPSRGGEPLPWTGAGQSLGDVAPIREPVRSRHRADAGEMASAVRAAAAGHAPPRERIPIPKEAASRRRVRALPITVKLGVSNRHIHISPEHLKQLFGSAPLTSARALLQPGQFAANETVKVIGPKGAIDHVRIVGPARGETQVELARSDAALIGIDPPLAASGSLDRSLGGVTLVGPNGRVELSRGVIIAARHLHLSPQDAERWGLRDGDRLAVRCGSGARAVTFHDVLVRSGPTHATELHLDVDEARAASLSTGDAVEVIDWREGAPQRRTFLTERDVVAIAERHERLPERAFLTPSARDRARALGLLDS